MARRSTTRPPRTPATSSRPAGPNSTSQRYDWKVDAYVGSNPIATGAIGHYTIDPPATIGGFRAALTGSDTSGPEGISCGAQLPNECQNLRQTPVLRWNPDPDVGFYKMYLTYDGINNAVPNLFGFVVQNTMTIDPAALPDSQAGSAYYWTVVPCTSPNVCAPIDHASHAFNKQSNQVVLTSPVTTDAQHPATVSNDVTLSWQDLLVTEANAATTEHGADPAGSHRGSAVPGPGLADPRLHAGDRPGGRRPDDLHVVRIHLPGGHPVLASPGHRRVREQPQLERPGVLPEGSPAPTLTYPVTTGGQMPEVNGTNPFTWNPLPFAASYDLEVYKNDDLIGQQGNRVLSVNTPVVAYAPSNLLPASSTPYTWRVRRVDASGNARTLVAVPGVHLPRQLPHPDLADQRVDAGAQRGHVHVAPGRQRRPVQVRAASRRLQQRRRDDLHPEHVLGGSGPDRQRHLAVASDGAGRQRQPAGEPG